MKRYLNVLVVAVFLLGAIYGVLPIRSIDAQETTDIWQGSLTVTQGDPLTVEEAVSHPYCSFKDVSFRKYRTPIQELLIAITGGAFTQQSIGRRCVVQNVHGHFTHETFSKEGVTTYELSRPNPTTHWMDPAPAGESVLFASRESYFHQSYRLSLERNYASNGKLVNGITNVKWHYTGGSKRLRDRDGNDVLFNDHAYSRNGRYLSFRSRSFVGVVDLATLQMTPVGYFPVWPDRAQLGVSNDGKHIVVYANGLYVFGAEGCQRSYASDDWDIFPYPGDSDYLGCTKSQDLIDRLEEHGDIASPLLLHRLYFSPNNSTLNVAVGIRKLDAPVSGSGPAYYDWREYGLAADGYTSSSEGYLAMGDSFSSGEGDTEGGVWYEAGTDEQGDIDTFAGRNLCHLSRRSYPYLLAIELGYLANNTTSPPADGLFHSVACSGAKIHNVIGVVGEKQEDGNANDFAVADNQYRYNQGLAIGVFQPGSTRQINFLAETVAPDGTDRPSTNPDVITIGIGGNDGGFGEFLEACTSSINESCEHAQPGTDKSRQLVNKIAQNKSRLTKTYRRIKEAAPEARIYVHGYPSFVEGVGGSCPFNVKLNGQERLFADNAVHYMNEVVKASAKEAGVFYVDIEDIFSGRKLCSEVDQSQIAVNGVTAGNDVRPLEGSSWLAGIGLEGGACIRACIGNESFHPRPSGHELYREAIVAQTNSFSAVMPDPQKTLVPLPNAFFGVLAIGEVARLNTNHGSPETTLEVDDELIVDINFFANTMTLNLAGFLPNSTVELSVQSDPLSLGEHQVDEDGNLVIDLVLPEGVGPGVHEIHATGLNELGGNVDKYQSVVLAASESDFDGDGVPNEQDQCQGMADSGTDEDDDGIDDGCDPHILVQQEEEESLTPCEKYDRIRAKIAELDRRVPQTLKLRRNIKRLRCKVWTIRQQETITSRQRIKILRLRDKIYMHRELLEAHRRESQP